MDAEIEARFKTLEAYIEAVGGMRVTDGATLSQLATGQIELQDAIARLREDVAAHEQARQATSAGFGEAWQRAWRAQWNRMTMWPAGGLPSDTVLVNFVYARIMRVLSRIGLAKDLPPTVGEWNYPK